MGQNGAIMAVFLVLLIPLLFMVFALIMERLEYRLRMSTMSEGDVEEFFENAKPDEVNTFIKEGWSGALASFRRRRTPRGRRKAAIPQQNRSSIDPPGEPVGGARHEGSGSTA
jgi:hypothetical protein